MSIKMKKLYENLYYNSPICLQNFITSVYGYKLKKIRYSGNYPEYLRGIQNNLYLTPKELEALQLEELKKILKIASLEVPYYKRLFEKNKISIEDIKTMDDVRHLPLLEKDVIRSSPETLISQKYSKEKLLIIHTTGTTSTPLKIYSNPDIRQKNYAFYYRFLINVNLNPQGKRATLGGRIILPANQNTPPYWRYSYFQKNLILSSYHITDSTIPFYIEKLIKFRPDIIDAYPSSLYFIARYAQKNNINLKGIAKGITTSAETLFDEQRQVMEEVFDLPIFDQYGAAEMCIFVAQCKKGRYHLHSDYSLIEFLKKDGNHAKEGEEGEIVCSGFINYIMPLIRYRIGDYAIPSAIKCECGSSFPVIEKLMGRIDDYILTPDGRKIGRLSPVFKGFPVKEVQYVQKTKDILDVNLIKDIGYNNETEVQVLQALRKRLGHEILIRLNYVDKITYGAGGKLKSIISDIKV
jgi:phenylacetate-CoA ligase